MSNFVRVFLKCWVVLIWLVFSQKTLANEKDLGKLPAVPGVVQFEATTIRGNQEQPRVLHLLPWQNAGDYRGISDDVRFSYPLPAIKMLDRETFQNQYLKEGVGSLDVQ